MSSNIEWTDETWNPVNKCDEVSPGCAHCCAKGAAGLSLDPWQLSKPAKMAKTRKIFVNSMSDLFHEDIPPRYVSHVISAMIRADWHIYQTLSKRPEMMLARLRAATASEELARHMWWGVSVENKRHGLPRVDMLRDAPVARRFLSIEPLLEDLGEINLDGIGWVIVGGESGTAPTVRPMRPGWVRSIRDQCLDAGVPFFFKQWGAWGWHAGFHPADRVRIGALSNYTLGRSAGQIGKTRAGNVLDGETWQQEPTWEARKSPERAERLEIVKGIEELAKMWEK